MYIASKEMTMEQRKEKLAELVQTFSQNKSYFLTKDFNEAQCRSQFIDILLECLKWDVKNEKGARPDKREVIPEDRIEIDQHKKHPDYSLCYGGERKIYVEAKQPSVDLKQDPEPALQVRRYAYTAKMPIAILTDFQELAVYDTRIKPKATDNASTARIEYFTFDKYVEKFDELYNKFSWDAVDLGKFDTYYESAKDKKGTATVDKDILEMIENWRILLAEDISLHNEEIDEYNLTTAVQKIIDRVLFLRICEDKEIEEYDSLKKIAESKQNVYSQLKEIFTKADAKFNSGLFASDTQLNDLILQDKTLCTIINALYYPICQYEFSVLPVEILGSIYERFLGKIIRFARKTKNGHSVEVIEKPEVQKAGGVYYTPTYIVKYIVKNTIGQKIKGKTPEQVSVMHFVDPACGSGSFLIGAYQYLLDWHLEYYDSDENRAKAEKKGVIYKDASTLAYKLSVDEKKRILLNNIYGVDIDAQAVEVTKLSLFLKLLENEGKALSSSGTEMFRSSDLAQDKILPSLTENIKCGNSLIGSDFYNDKDLTLFEISDQRKVNVFDWGKAFPKVFGKDSQGFDCVIGNPPYVNINTMPEYHDYFKQQYEEIHTGYNDLMYYFVYRGIKLLSKEGLFGVITSNYFIGNDYAKKLRLFLNTRLNTIVNFHNALIFDEASVHTTLLFATNTATNKDVVFYNYTVDKPPFDIKLDDYYNICSLERETLTDTWIVADSNSNSIIDKLKNNSVPLGELTDIAKGPESGKNNIFTVKENIINQYQLESTILRRFIKNSDIKRYSIKETTGYLIYCDNSFQKKQFPNIYKYLEMYKTELLDRRGPRNNEYEWWRLHRPSDKSVFDAKEKLVVPYRAEHNRFAYDDQQFFNDGGDIRAIVMKEDSPYSIKYILTLLNSTLLDWFYGFIGKAKGNSREYFNKPLAEIPISKATPEQQAPLIKLADQMLVAHKSFAAAKSDSDKTMHQQRIDILDGQINALVYKLYGLTEEEIKVVEGR